MTFKNRTAALSKIKKWVTALVFLMICQISYAETFGFEMFLIALEQLKQLQAQYSLLMDTYQNSKAQVDSLNQLKNMNSGHYGFGDLNNSLDALKSWQSPVGVWQDALQNLSGGNPSRYQALIDAYEKNHPSLDGLAYSQFTTPGNAARFTEDKAVNRAVQVQTTDIYNQINQHMDSLHQLSKQIEKAPNTKGALDLNSRLISEIGFIQLMSVRLQALTSQQASQDSLAELQDRAEVTRFNHWTE
jgi:type IV secretion system protein VirB5